MAARERLTQGERRLVRAEAASIAANARTLAHLASRLKSAAPDSRVFDVRVLGLQERLVRAMHRRLGDSGRLGLGLRHRLVLLDPHAVLERGYAIARDEDGAIVRDTSRPGIGQSLTVEVARGRFATRVVTVTPDDGGAPDAKAPA